MHQGWDTRPAFLGDRDTHCRQVPHSTVLGMDSFFPFKVASGTRYRWEDAERSVWGLPQCWSGWQPWRELGVLRQDLFPESPALSAWLQSL